MNQDRIYKPGRMLGGNETARAAVNINSDENASLESRSFPITCLPPVAMEMAKAIAKTERTPETLAGCCVLGMLSAGIGAGLQIKSGPNRKTRGNLYIIASAESGSGKSESFRHVVAPFLAHENNRPH